jgi:hypothetical protein
MTRGERRRRPHAPGMSSTTGARQLSNIAGNTNPILCSRCKKKGHEPRECKAAWHKAWPGEYVTRLGIRFPDGSAMEYVAPLSEKLGKELFAFYERACAENVKRAKCK